jgi:hypothetical protein
MYSVKPGRGPSAMGAIGGIIAIAFGIFWIAMASSMGAPPFFIAFGVLFIVAAIAGVIYNAYNATAKDRVSNYEITTDREEQDPISRALGHGPAAPPSPPPDAARAGGDSPGEGRRFEGSFCPYCGAGVQGDFNFCPKCGKDI